VAKRRTALVLLALTLTTGCASRTAELAGPPPIPARAGPLAIDVVYPPDSALVAVRDSNFIFGSVGHGGARLTIDGQDVPVQPNGAFLAWLPVPGSTDDSLAQYVLVASLGDEVVRAVHTIRVPTPSMPLPRDTAMIDLTSVTPQGAWWVRDGEEIPIRVRASSGASVRLYLPAGDTLVLSEGRAGTGGPARWIFGQIPASMNLLPSGVFEGRLTARSPLGRGQLNPSLGPVPATMSAVETYCAMPADSGLVANRTDSTPAAEPAVMERGAAEAAIDTAAPDMGLEYPEGCAVIEVTTARDTSRVPLPLDLWVLPQGGPVVELIEGPSDLGGDGLVVGRAAPGATTLWMWAPGLQARVTGRRNESLRIALDGRTEAWVPLGETVWRRGASSALRARVGTVRLETRADRVLARIAVSQPRPYQVGVDGHRLTLILHGAYADTNWLRYGADDPFLRSVRWEQRTSDRYLLHLEFASAPWGYRVEYQRGALVLEVRRPPAIDSERPLSGRRIAVDPGHPPAGSVGPTRLYEGDANLAVAYRLKRLLEEQGATVIMTRSDQSPVRLYDRTRLAESLNAEILVSIHNNALPDGVNPFENHGTSVYYFHPGSLDLARALQRSLLEALGLRDLGIGRASLALARPTWMPAVLTEGAFMMMPEQEAGLRDPVFQEAYARGVLAGIREFLLERSE